MHQPLPNFVSWILAHRGRHLRIRSERPPVRGGFTILEICVVLLVMGILAAAAVPTFFSSLQYHELESAARRVVLDLQLARHAARVQSEPQSLTFTNATTYELSAGVHGLDSSDEIYAVDLADHPYELDTVTLNLDDETSVSFDGYGSTATSGTIVLARGDSTRTVTINGATGTISYSNP